MTNVSDFALPSCPGIPDAMWLAAAYIINTAVTICWYIFGLVLAINLAQGTYEDILNERLNIRRLAKTLSKAILVGLFLSKYKTILMLFDQFIDTVFVFGDEPLYEASKAMKEKDKMTEYYKNFSFFTPIQLLITGIFSALPKIISFFTHRGAINFMHYVKAISLVITSMLGPFAAVLSLLPSVFKHTFSTWVKSYVHLSCWSIVLNIFSILSKSLVTISISLKSDSAAAGFKQDTGSTFLSFILFFAIFLTPVWTSKLISGAVVANIGNALHSGFKLFRDIAKLKS
ncbi:MAG: hypothetical protein ACYC2U_06365 [Candidatus Amoebophilus sp.]